MSIVMPLRVAETTATTGTGSLTLAGAINAAHRSFADQYGAGTSWCYYVIEWGGGFEIGRGQFNGSDTLTRAEIIRSSNGDAVVNLPAGAKTVFALLDLGEPEWGFTGSLVAADVTKLPGSAARFTGGSPATAALPAVATLPRGFAVKFVNAGTANLTIDPDGAETIGGATTLVLLPGQTATAVRRPGGWDAIDAAVRRAGDTMSGDLAVAKASPGVTLNATGATDSAAILRISRNGTVRWDIGADGGAAQNWFLNRFNDAGVFQDTPLIIDRATGRAIFAHQPQVPAGGATAMHTWHGFNLADGVSAVLPAGGTWAWFLFAINASGNVTDAHAGLAAGGTTVWAGSPGLRFRGFAWRYV